MTASRPDPRAAARALLAAGLALAGCATPAARPTQALFQGELAYSPIVPDVADHTAADLAVAAMASTAPDGDAGETGRALQRLEAIDRVLVAAEESPTGLVPAGRDLLNATRGDDRHYRAATRELLRRGDLDPALEGRLEMAEADDPLALADARIRDAHMIAVGRAFNSLAEPVGRSVLTTAAAPYRLARSLVDYAVAVYNEEALPLQHRQALAHWKSFVSRYPDAPESRALEPRIAAAQARWNRTQRDRAVELAERALEKGQVRLALVFAERALDHVPEDRRAAELRDEAAERLVAQRESWSRSLEALREAEVAPAAGRALALALMRPDGDVAGEARALLESDRRGPLADEARFAAAVALGEGGREDAMWSALEEIAEAEPERSNMARHANALRLSPSENPYGAFRLARGLDRRERALWVVLGPWAHGPPDRGLPRLLEWLIGAPGAAQSALGIPLRALQLPWMKALPSERVAAVYAERYLARHPQGDYADEVRGWLQSHHEDRDNWLGALRVAEQRPDLGADERAELREKAAEQALGVARREQRRDRRNALFRRLAREFPETEAGHRAGAAAREEVMAATPQQIRLTRGFLQENPSVAGPRGLGLVPQLLDGDPTNGELHPEGVALVGARDIELSFVEGGDDDPPVTARQTLTPERMARFVSQLEETSYRNALVDQDDEVGSDAQRDVFFERARLGLTEQPDMRPTAYSTYRYEGMKERYGVVRARESILPFELVLQGSLTDLSLGAFPRLRKPRETPDAFLYR